MNRPIQLGVLISGGGTTLVNIHDKITGGQLEARIRCVVSSSKRAAGVDKARQLGYPVHVIGRKKYPDDDTYSAAINTVLAQYTIDLVVLAGFLKKYLPAEQFSTACINIHPALIPAFCGYGYYGMRVHEAVWQKGCRVSGCTVHLVTPEYDAGPIIIQKAVALKSKDSPEAIRAKVFALECQAMPEAIALFQQGRIRFEGTRAVIEDD